MYYHASPVAGLTELRPRPSNHQVPLVYFSTKPENVLVYLSNAVEKYCREKGFAYTGVWEKWASYGFDPDGIQRIEEYYPGALEDTYRGVGGYLYAVREVEDCGFPVNIPHVAASARPVPVCGCTYIPDAYEAILRAQGRGLVRILRYEERTEAMDRWIAETVRREYREAAAHPDYRFFLEGKFPGLLGEGSGV